MRFSAQRPAATAAVIAALAAAGTGWWWASAAHSDPVSIAADREAAESAGETAVATLTTANYTTADADLRKWETVTTGPLLDQIRAGHAQGVTALQTAKSTTTARVLDAALSQLDPQAGTAQLMAVVEVTASQGATPAAVKRNRFQATVTRTADGWKLSAVQPVTVSL
ncbi:hypothetical protein QRX50_27290 [Amycolatopsis carbonis]|uniref:Mce-associated membrane protein n=1 Tax=Amycolatopsis carbonis TaxID=715471 RepID=A0A9Y2I8F4_9PSEU|nr:hypothetical protein [Amycolatopsis sp. 2-15]WIX75239.1 hypothetical protein QRX50_27290 [Amycolatopsis sp. 2-15]